MNQKEYMEQLAYLLQDVSEGEREEALQYYKDYFDDAGESEEASVIATLGSPEKVAAIIKDGLNSAKNEAGEYTDRGYSDDRFREDNKVPEVRENATQNQSNGYEYNEYREKNGGQSRGRVNLPLIIILCILALPIILPLVAAGFGMLGAILAVGAAIAVAAIAITFSGLLVGIILLGIGIAKLFVSPPIGLLVIGLGLVILAIGLVMACVGVAIFGKFIPWFIRVITDLGSRVFRRRGGQSA